MKKIFVLVIAFVILTSIGTFASAAASISADHTVNLVKNQTTGSFKIIVNNENAFAGCEFAVLCGEGVTIKSVSYSGPGAMTAGPVQTNGKTIFSFFSGDNNFSGTVTATVTFEISAGKNTNVTLSTAKIYTKNGSIVEAEELSLNETVEINVEESGAPITPSVPANNPGGVNSNTDTTPSSGDTTNDSSGQKNNSSSGGKNDTGSGGKTSDSTGGKTTDNSGNSATDSSEGVVAGNPDFSETKNPDGINTDITDETLSDNPEDVTTGDNNSIGEPLPESTQSKNIPLIITLSVVLGLSLIANGAFATLYFTNKKR